MDHARQTDAAVPSKTALVRALHLLECGTKLNEIMGATCWLACWCRSFLTSQRKHRRYKLRRQKRNGISGYTLEALG